MTVASAILVAACIIGVSIIIAGLVVALPLGDLVRRRR